jgi:hypothetical protein
MRLLSRIALVAILGLTGREAVAQATAAQPVTIVPRGGYIRYDDATSLKPTGFIGFEVLYRVAPFLSLGPSINIARPTTNGDDFPAAFTYGDTTFLFRAQQPVTMFDAGLSAHATLPTFSVLSPYLIGGIGYYTLYLDPQTSGAEKRYGRASYQFGGGADIRFSANTGIRLEVRDLVMSNFDRDRLNPVGERFNGYTRFASAFPERTPSTKGAAMHNLMFSIGFTVRPSLGDDNSEGNP